MPDETNSARPDPVRVGIAGLGRSGWNIHAETILRMSDRFRVVAAIDASPERQAEAKARFGCEAATDIQALNSDPNVELVVVATPNHLHAPHAIAAMEAGKHVLCEKPFAMSLVEADQMIATSRRTGRMLTVFQNRRFDPHFQKVREIIDSGVLGWIVQVRFAVHSFSRRWDWQTLKEFGGGTLNNMGAHFLDQLLSFFPGALPAVNCFADRVLTLGDAEDHCVVMLRSPGCPLVQMELSSACGYPQENWLIMGTRGTLRGWFDRLEWRVAQFDQVPTPVLDRQPMPDRSYNNEKIPWQDFTWAAPLDQTAGRYTHERFYESLYATLRQGAPLTVTPEQARRQMQVMDACRVAQNTSVK
jgi:scyllo-inositol 2-dehydrogenase (NADP+)